MDISTFTVGEIAGLIKAKAYLFIPNLTADALVARLKYLWREHKVYMENKVKTEGVRLDSEVPPELNDQFWREYYNMYEHVSSWEDDNLVPGKTTEIDEELSTIPLFWIG